METRDDVLLKLRPKIDSVKTLSTTSSDESFQNQVLRPVILIQEELLLNFFKNYIRKHKNYFYNLSVEKKLDYIDTAFQKDFKFLNVIRGIVIGMFTIKEYDIYTHNSSALNKRMTDLIRELLKNNLQLFELQKNRNNIQSENHYKALSS